MSKINVNIIHYIQMVLINITSFSQQYLYILRCNNCYDIDRKKIKEILVTKLISLFCSMQLIEK